MTNRPLEHACELTRKGFRWARTRHPWVYRDDLASASGSDGDIVRVLHEGRVLGSAFLGTRSKIALRWIERSEEPREPGAAFWRERLVAAHAKRAAIAARTDAYRAVHDAADGFPGLVADRYGSVAVLQSTTAGAERLLSAVAEEIAPILGVEAVVARNDLLIREKEGLPRERRVLRGACPERVWVREDGPLGRIEYPVDPLAGQKTGAYLDQRENRWAAAERARGRFLDAFSHGGLFALHAARRATEAVAVDSSAAALELCEEAARRSGLANVRTVRANVFDYLKDASERGESFDVVVLDPPAFAKSRAEVPAAVRGYREINRKAMGLLGPGGTLVTCSCSYNLSEEGFLEVLREAAAGARADFRLLEKRGQAADHPVVLAHPESAYLKCFILEKC
jgi:23S rRNA (cytosine1962-C5)-methyltransferase